MAGLTNPLPNAGAPPAPAPALPSAPPAGPTSPPTPAPVAAPGGPQQPPQGQQPKGPPIGEGPVDPELLKKMIANCMNAVTGGLKAIVNGVQQAQDKVAALAQATVLVVIRVEDSLEQAGGKLNLAMTFEAGAETLSDIADAVSKAGVYSYAQKELDAAFLRAVDQYRMIRAQQGRLDPAMFQQKVAQLKQSQANGTLDQQYPGLTQFAKQAQKAAKPKYQPQGQAAPAADDGDGTDAEDAQDQGDDEAGEGDAPAAAPVPGATPKPTKAPMPQPGQTFPPAMLKPKKGQHLASAHLRANPGSDQKKRRPKPKAKAPAKAAGPNDFPATMLNKRKPAAPAQSNPKKGGI